MTREELIKGVNHAIDTEPTGCLDLLLYQVRDYLSFLSAAHTIKPLVFVRIGDHGYSNNGERYLIWNDSELGWCWRDRFDAHPKHPYDSMCESYEKAAELCQQHWESEAGIGKYLERVK